MGITLDRFYLSPPSAPGAPHLLVRVVRPAAPNAAQPAVDFADDLADAKAAALQRAWHAAVGGEGPAPETLGRATPLLDADAPADRPLLAVHGGELDLWWTPSERWPRALQIGPGATEEVFWAWLDEFVSDRELATLRRPAQAIRARLLTEAELRFVDAPLLLVDDVDWLTAEEFDHLHRGGGLEALLAGVPERIERVEESAIVAVKRELVDRALAAELNAGDRRSAAFRAAEVARLDPPSALALIERLVDELQATDDHRAMAWALGYALHKARPSRERDALRRRLEARGGDFVAAMLREFAGIEADEAEDG